MRGAVLTVPCPVMSPLCPCPGLQVDEKLKKMDAELMGYKKQMSKMKPGPARKQVEAKALRLLKQKKMYEKQRESLYNQSFNLDQTRFAQENVKETVVVRSLPSDTRERMALSSPLTAPCAVPNALISVRSAPLPPTDGGRYEERE
jgi:hypothetical protein